MLENAEDEGAAWVEAEVGVASVVCLRFNEEGVWSVLDCG